MRFEEKNMRNVKKHFVLLIIAMVLIGGYRAESAITDRVGVMGDSLSDMTMFSDTTFYNWIWQLGTVQGWSFGTNFEYDYAKSGATTLTVISQGQHTSLAAVNPTLAVLLIGGNDLAFDLLLTDPLPSDLNAFADERINAIRTAIETVAGSQTSPTGTKVVLFTTPEVMRVPIFLTLYSGFTSETINAYDYVVARMNNGIRALAAERNWPVIDLYQLMIDLVGSRTNPNASFILGGVSINLQSYSYNDPKPTDGFRKDGFHPNTVLQGLMANAVVLAVNAAYGETLPTMSDQTILATAGVTTIPAGESYYDLSSYIGLGQLGPGDANGDGQVDVGDLGILAANYGGTNKTWAMGDFNGDGKVDVGDLGILAANYGTGSSSASDFDADYAKVFGTATESTTTEDSTTDDSDNSICSSLGLSLIAGLALMGLMLVKMEE
jgi:lysophospholipase L1-like esterase/uncharacterized protein (DUF2141 family)